MLDVNIKEIDMKFNTSNEVFSPQNVDKGTLAMLSTVEFKADDKVLDLGCGYGIVGILAAKIVGATNVVMTDIDVAAVKLASENITLNDVEGVKLYQSDGFKNMDDKEFNLILSNPPYHVDFSVPKEFIEKGFNRLEVGGKMFMVTKRKDWYKNKLISIFGGVKISEIDGYYVFMAEKKTTTYSNKKK
ncbi:methyltransferase [Clostridium bowmanii]|uniref:class I SAM-dependent methyltransferase n=1 Tax=Clostridium bowmanii TaxID=132925 RepID=UPI001C0DC2BA|nr:methyltransferase [Clostridium bowmanii]MBU3189062.1 methyltransferase [Clostridium bowmanii]MCA1073836.1 methyltransferase [Clostridium bowmanii]